MKAAPKTKPKQSSRGNLTFIGAWVPEKMAEAVDTAVEAADLDRSKFLRRALEEKVAKETAEVARKGESR